MQNTPEPTEMLHPLDVAAKLAGGRAEFARRLKVSLAAPGNWKKRGVPIEHCVTIERLTGRKVTRQMLRPSDWKDIWPELDGTSAPAAVLQAA